MGTPYTRNGSLSMGSYGLGDTTGSAVDTRKRTFDSLDSLDESMWDLTEDGRPKTRRVNPLRLAMRLGPDLVAEMEALIVPGAKMPTFSVRKDFQERYCVDRRHIYDYFHSRGLRVAKEDKHTNLIRGRAMKAEAQSQAASKLPSAIVKRETVICDATLQRPFLAKVAPTSARGRTRQIKVQGTGRGRGLRLPRPSSTISSKRIKKSPSTNGPDFIEMLPGGVSSESGIGASSSGTDTDWESTCPEFTITTDLSEDLPEKSNAISDFLHSSPDTFGSSYFSSPMETSTFLDMETAATCGANLDMLMTVEEHRLLTKDERTELYNLIDNSMPQAHGIEGSSGTYNLYMNERSRPSFDPLLHVNRQVRPVKLGVQENKISKSTHDFELSMDYVDVRKWLSEDMDLSDVGLGTLELHAFGNEFDPSFGFGDVLSSLDAGSSCDIINGSAAHIPMHVQNQYSSEKSFDIDPINTEIPNNIKKSRFQEENIESNDAQRHVLSSLTSTYGRVRTTSARGGI